jgi:hypothetical protein
MPKERGPSIKWIHKWVHSRTGLDVVMKRKVHATSKNQIPAIHPTGNNTVVAKAKNPCPHLE